MFYKLQNPAAISYETFNEQTIGFVNPQPLKCPMLYKFSTAEADNPKVVHPPLTETGNVWCVSKVAKSATSDNDFEIKVYNKYSDESTPVENVCNEAE